MKVLIADDDLTMRLMLDGLLSAWGFEPEIVKDGQTALDCLSQPDAPRLALLDWEMPSLKGPQVCARIRAVRPIVPLYLILLTVHDDKDHIVSGLQSGADDFISKPFNRGELQARLRAGQRLLALQDDLAKANKILSAERRVVEDILLKMRETEHFDQRNLRDLQVPVERTSGDVLFSAYREDGTQHVLLGDFTGHGLSAAIGGPMVSDVFYSMTRKGFTAAHIVTEMNQRLSEKLPTGLFLAAVMLAVSPDRRSGTVFNCGMQDVLLFRGQKLIERCRSENLALGITRDNNLVEHRLALQSEDRLYLYSDGLVEVENHEGEQFGVPRLVDAISQMLTAQTPLDELCSTVVRYGQLDLAPDDLTLVEVTC